MRVDRIELIGFKSFSERTIFNLHPGITCIVGPNGCGKSNVVDSFKWVLGEQSAKSLRGEKMEEVIFTGSQSKKPKGMAEVALCISGLNGSDNGKESELTVARRLYRSGDSEYMLNRTACRLRDIRDIFLDTGLEVKSYSILEQDRISAMLTAKPEDRRFLIEEVAGVVKYKVRRNEAQSKLDSSRSNLQRISDVIGEVKRQINFLDRQVKKAERYKRLLGELRSIELKIAKRDYTALSQALDEILSQYEALREEVATRRAGLAQGENELETKRIGLLDKETHLNALQQDLQEMGKDIAELERSIAVSNTETENLREYALKLRLQQEETQEKRRASLERTGQIRASREALRAELDTLNAEISDRAESLTASEGEIAEREHLLEDRRRDAFRVAESLSHLRNEHQRHLAALEGLQKREDDIRQESADLQGFIEETGSSIREIEASIADKEGEVLTLGQDRERLAREAAEAEERLEALRGDLALQREELASSSSRLESLRELVFSESTGEALKGEGLQLLASVSDIMEVPKEYEKAVEGALREIITGFILPAYEDVKLAVKSLKTRDMERTAFIPLNAEERSGEYALPEGVIARAADLVKARDGFSPVVKNLLRGVLVVRDLEAALNIKHSNGVSLVTLEGETVEPSGAVIAGKSRGVLTLKRQIRELSEEIEGRRAAIEAMQADMASTRTVIEEREAALRDAEQRKVELERELSLIRLRLERQNEEAERARKKLSYLGMEQEGLSREREEISGLLREKEAGINGLEEERRQIEAAISDIQGEISGKRAAYEQKRTESVDIRLSINSCKERLAALQNEEDSIGRLLVELEEKERFIENETASTETRIEERKKETADREASLKELVIKANELSTRISGQREVISGESEELLGAEKALRELRGEIELRAQRLSELDVQRAEHKLRMENLTDNIKNTYDVDLDSVEAEPVTPEDEEDLPVIRKKLEDLGPVSLGSIEEYEELRGRYEFLTKQQEDLQRSIAELEEAISKINSTTRRKLREAFDALKEKFSVVFTSLFGGGRAELVMTDEHNILETGIDVIAQPPGKRLQNINLLSGGEKSLAALALLFASFLIKPTPLCILDEADAALDEANTEKFSQMIKDLSRDIQFIVVTHNRVTMETADYIYGITMEEPGVSKVISMQLTEA
jgi:chromosome segregation protein